MYVLPKHIWENVDDPIEFQNLEMIGSGPFKLAREQAARVHPPGRERGLLEGQPPTSTRSTSRPTSNADARVQALTNGDIDAISEFPPTAFTALNNAEGVTVHVADIGAGGDLTRHPVQHGEPGELPDR